MFRGIWNTTPGTLYYSIEIISLVQCSGQSGTLRNIGTLGGRIKMLGLPAGKIHFDQQSQLYGFFTSLSGARDSPTKSLLPSTRDTQRLFSGALPTCLYQFNTDPYASIISCRTRSGVQFVESPGRKNSPRFKLAVFSARILSSQLTYPL